jgi:hypothetical protein
MLRAGSIICQCADETVITMILTINSVTTVPLPSGANAPVSVAGVQLDPNNTPLYQNGATQPAIFCGTQNCTFNVSVSLSASYSSEPVPAGPYTLTGLLPTTVDGNVAIFETTSFNGMTYTGAVTLLIQAYDFLYVGPTIQWNLVNAAGTIATADTPLEIYFIPKTPVAKFVSGIPVELLRKFSSFVQPDWQIRQTAASPLTLSYSLDNQSQPTSVSMDEEIAMAVLFCYNIGVQYNSAGSGKPGFFSRGNFNLLSWVEATAPGSVCSCEDQTAVLWMMLTTLFGRTVNTCYLHAKDNPLASFYPTAQGLIGILNPGQPNAPYPILVNNPMYGGPFSPISQAAWVYSGAPPLKTGFSNHRFCMVMDANSVIADATIGPYLGILQQKVYLPMITDPGTQQPQLEFVAQTNFTTFIQYASL